LHWQVERLTKVPSTQTIARALAESKSAEGRVVIAEAQTEGRGRGGREWHSGVGGIYMTVVLGAKYAVSLIPLMAGVAVSDAIRDTADIDAWLKWPNDILVDGRKVCGMLAESAWFRGELKHVLLGIGVNLNNLLPPSLTEATTLSNEIGEEIDITRFIRELLQRLGNGLDLLKYKPGTILEAWRGRSSTLGRRVEVVISPSETISGFAVDVNQDGALVLDVGGKRRPVLSGSLRDATVKF
jgi:BirA family biotin operon repressor/biotin-[acetyl-CoA-carboxylase] ligase